VAAETVVRTGESVSVDKNQVVENDFYAAAGSLSISGEISEDLYAVGGSITQNGLVGADMTAVGGSIQLHAPVADDVRLAGGDIVIADNIGGDVFVFAGMLKVLSSASIAGNIYFYGGEAEISGKVSGSIMGASEKIRVDGSVGGDIDVAANSLVLGDKANVSGDVRYDSSSELTRAQNAVVGGQIIRSELTKEKESFVDKGSLTGFLIWLFTTLSLYLFFRSDIVKLINSIHLEPARSGIIGLGVMIFVPVVTLLLIVTLLGSLIGAMGLISFVVLVITSAAIAPILVGQYIAKMYKKDAQINLWTVFIGVSAVWLLSFVPVLGSLAVFVALLLTLGGISYSIYQFLR